MPPFTPRGTATSFFDVFFEVEVAGLTLHNNAPKRMRATISHKPPAPGETYENPDLIPLFTEDGHNSGFRIGSVSHTPNPAGRTDIFPNSLTSVTVEGSAVSETVHAGSVGDRSPRWNNRPAGLTLGRVLYIPNP